MFTGGDLTTGQIADLVGGTLTGNPNRRIAGVAPLDRAGPGDLSFVAHSKYADILRTSRAGVVLVAQSLAEVPGGPDTRIIVPDAMQALAAVLRRVTAAAAPWGLHPTASIGAGTGWSGRISLGAGAILGAGVRLGSDCRIGPGSRIGDRVAAGNHVTIGAGVTVDTGVVLGDHVVVQDGARIGVTGFRYLQSSDLGRERMPHLGGCVVGRGVEIGANTTIARGLLGETVVGEDTKIDNLVHIAHNVRIGSRCVILAQVGIAGSTTIEDDVVLAGQAGIADHLTVGRGARVAAQGGVIGNIAPGATVSGYPARDHRTVLRQAAALQRLAPLTTALQRLVRDHPARP